MDLNRWLCFTEVPPRQIFRNDRPVGGKVGRWVENGAATADRRAKLFRR